MTRSPMKTAQALSQIVTLTIWKKTVPNRLELVQHKVIVKIRMTK